ncbi:MAG: cytochrome C, partial [Hyphomicrobiaceae bacterium]
MKRALKNVLWLVLPALLVATAGYFIVLPQLGAGLESPRVTDLQGDAQRGKYLVIAAGCIACHTDFKAKGEFLAGGAALKTPFGTFYAPNITSDKTYGIGGW